MLPKRENQLTTFCYMVLLELEKQQLAYVIAKEMNRELKQVTGPSLEKPGDVAAILTSLKKGSIFL